MSKVEILKNILIPEFYYDKKISYKTFKEFPFIKNSKGEPIVPINMYLSSFLNTNLSENTIKRVSFCLKLLVDYCELKKINLKLFIEDDLISFSKYLQEEKDVNGKVRNHTTINNILFQTIKFFDFFGKTFLNNENFIKNILNVSDYKISVHGYIKESKLHKSMVLNSEKNTRNPISINDIDLIYQNIGKIYVSKFAQERTKVLLKLLEHTGARIGELSLIKTTDILNAINNEKGLLELTTLKRRKESKRFVPVDKSILNQINTFIKIYRKKIINKTLKDNGYLFINENTGDKINSGSLSNDFNRLKTKLGIKSELCAHMFRHRFITNIFINLIKEYDFQNENGIRNALLDINTLKAHVIQLTGHKDTNSLDTYLHLARSEMANMPELLKKLDEQTIIDSKEARERYLFNELKLGNITTQDYIKEIEKIKN